MPQLTRTHRAGPTPRHRRPVESADRPRDRRRAALILVGVLVAGLGSTATLNPPSVAVGLTADLSSSSCQGETFTSVASADAWIDENSALASKGSDSVLNVDAGSANADTGLVSGRMRALVRFPLPSVVPPGCVVE